ncbi:HEPN domain-containing protein [Streptomyces griseoincarnatus]
MAQAKKSGPSVSDWWLPGQQEKRTPGVYAIQDSGNVTATLHRALGSAGGSIFDLPDYEMVHGVSFGKAITLVNNRVRKARMGMSTDQAEIEIAPRYAIEGLWLGRDELKLTRAKVRIQRQDEWTRPRTFRVDHDSDKKFIKAVTYTEFPEVTSEIPNGRVTVADASSYRSNEEGVTLKTGTEFHFHFDTPVDLHSFVAEELRGLQVLMTLATGVRCGVERFRLTNSEWQIEGAEREEDRWCDVRMWAPTLTPSRRRGTFLFPYSSMDWTSQAPLFFGLSEAWKYVIEQWALLLDDRFVWPVARFATAASAVEALDRILHSGEKYEADMDLSVRILETLKSAGVNAKDRKKVKSALSRPKEISLAERMRRLSDYLPGVMDDVVREKQWTDRVARLRHVVSHGLESSDGFAQDVRPLQCGTEVLLHLLESVFLFHVGFTGEQVKAMQARNSNHRRREIVDECFELLPSIEANTAQK